MLELNSDPYLNLDMYLDSDPYLDLDQYLDSGPYLDSDPYLDSSRVTGCIKFQGASQKSEHSPFSFPVFLDIPHSVFTYF